MSLLIKVLILFCLLSSCSKRTVHKTTIEITFQDGKTQIYTFELTQSSYEQLHISPSNCLNYKQCNCSDSDLICNIKSYIIISEEIYQK